MLVYDPFMGIGSTALACVSLGVNYIGTEIDAEYIKIAQQQFLETLKPIYRTTKTIHNWQQEKRNYFIAPLAFQRN